MTHHAGNEVTNQNSVKNNDDETLTDDNNRIDNDEINRFPDTIISEDDKNQLPFYQNQHYLRYKSLKSTL